MNEAAKNEKEVFEKNESEYKCIAPGWIKLTDYVKKYFPGLTNEKRVNKHDALRKVMQRTPDHLKAKAGNATYVLEKEFCVWRHIDYIEES